MRYDNEPVRYSHATVEAYMLMHYGAKRASEWDKDGATFTNDTTTFYIAFSLEIPTTFIVYGLLRMVGSI